MQVKQRYPWFKFFPTDWLAQSQLFRLSVTSEGCFLRLLCHCWVHGSIPADRSALASICDYYGDQLDAAIAMFIKSSSEPGRLYHPGLETVRQAAVLKHNERVKAGKKGAISRWSPKLLEHPVSQALNG